MDIRLTRLTDTTHRFEVLRPDGTGERAGLETKSFLVHDLAHASVEAEVPIPRGFYGALAAGATLAELATGRVAGPDLVLAESLSGPFQSAWHGRLDPDTWLTLLLERAPAADPWDLDARIRERMRRLLGAWRATPFGGVLTLRWPPAPL